MTNKIETFLPLFSGFYGTIWEMDTDSFEHHNDVEYDDLDIDHKSYEMAIVEAVADAVQDNCPFITAITVQGISSPREYNFRNDSGNVVIEYNVDDFAAYLIENKDSLNDYLKEKYTSRSGFISFYDNSFDEWFDQTDGFKNLLVDSHRLGSLLDFYFDNEGIREDNIYYGVEVYAENYITIKEKYVSDLDSHEQEMIAEYVLREQDFDTDFGYMGVLIKDYKQKAELLCMDWQKLMAEEQSDFILDETKTNGLDSRDFYHVIRK